MKWLAAGLVGLAVACSGGPSNAEQEQRSCEAFHEVLTSDDSMPDIDVVHEAGVDAVGSDNSMLAGAWVALETGLLLDDEAEVRQALDTLAEECGPPPELEND